MALRCTSTTVADKRLPRHRRCPTPAACPVSAGRALFSHIVSQTARRRLGLIALNR